MVLKIKKQVLSIDRLDRWIFYSLLATAAVLPLAVSRPLWMTYDMFDLPKIVLLRGFILIAVSIWAIKLFISERLAVRSTKLDFAVAGFLVVAFVSTLASPYFPTALHGHYRRFEGFLTFLSYGMLYFLALQSFTDTEKLSSLSKTIALTGGLVALYGVIQFMGLDPIPWTKASFELRRSFSTFGNPNFLAGFLVLAVPIATAEFLRARSLQNNILLGMSLFLGLASLLTTFTRGAWIGIGVALTAFALIAGKENLSNKKVLSMLIAIAIVFVFVAVYSISAGHDTVNIATRLQTATQLAGGSTAERLEIWKSGWQMIKASPLVGTGPDTFGLVSGKYQTLKYVRMEQGQGLADNAHNYIIHLTAGVGVPAMLLFIMFFFTVVGITIKRARKIEGSERLIYAGLVSATIGYFIHLLFNISVVGSTGIFWIILGSLVATTATLEKKEFSSYGSSATYLKAFAIALVAVSLLSTYYAAYMFAADNHYARALVFSGEGQTDEADAHFNQAIQLYQNGKYFDDYSSFLSRAGLAQHNPDTINKAIGILKEVEELEPYEADHSMLLANTYAKIASGPGDPAFSNAMMELNKAVEKRPYAFLAHRFIAELLLKQGKYREALDKLAFALNLSPDDIIGNQLIAQCYQGLGDKRRAKNYYKKVLSLQPDNQEAKTALASLAK